MDSSLPDSTQPSDLADLTLPSELLTGPLTALGLDPEVLIPRFQLFYQLLLEANQRMNLTRITGAEAFCHKHLLDSLSILPELPDNTVTLLDVGTGGGIPGLPLWLARPTLQLSLLDSVVKKLKVIDGMVEALIQRFPELGAHQPRTLHLRAEDAGHAPEHRQVYDAVIARAVAPLPVLAELCLPLVKRTGVFIAMKGPSYESETDGLSQICGLLGARLDRVRELEIGGEQRVLLVFEKRSLTPRTLPRPPGQAKRKPLNEFI
ncbi:MAG: 16S rRNA (guanine(527)-N(7))-methyltransferase RsmG [Candidatus Melainabacteria bacterium HGW-Melainabacteria-1]|nr:MAG: 16S rRNA (guanine(527)-N(7))-methyltransferase RsmG [Candidatus Melainabacteria bacterium HGW-Melainabacteria-1]